jgi:hypothetical protein
MEFPEPYHSLPIREWRKYMKAYPNSYATACVRQWLRDRRKWRLVCHDNAHRAGEIQRCEHTRYNMADLVT